MRNSAVRAVVQLLIGGLLVWLGSNKTQAPEWAFETATVVGALVILRVLWLQFVAKPRGGKQPRGMAWRTAQTTPFSTGGRILPPKSEAAATVQPVDLSVALRGWETAEPSALWQAGANKTSQEPQPNGTDSDIFAAFGAVA